MNTSLLKQKAKMLEEYFNIYIDSNGDGSQFYMKGTSSSSINGQGNSSKTTGDGSQFYMNGTSSSSINGQGNSSKTTVSLSDARGKIQSVVELKLRSSDESRIFQEQVPCFLLPLEILLYHSRLLVHKSDLLATGDGSQFYMKGTSSSSINGQGNSSKTTVSLSDARGKIQSVVELKLRSSDELRIFQEQVLVRNLFGK
nr:DNA mismatch repair protein MLH1 isoform X6 [Ipomoea batatas]